MEGQTSKVGDYHLLKFFAVVVIAVLFAIMLAKWGDKALRKYRIKQWMKANPGKKLPVSMMLDVTAPAAAGSPATVDTVAAAVATTPVSTPAAAIPYGPNTGFVPPATMQAAVM